MAQAAHSRFAQNQSNPGDAAAVKAQEIAAKLSQTLTGQPYVNNTASVSITMDIPVAKVGLVIGRAGTTIRNIQDTSGSRLQLDSTGEPTRLLRITGSHESVEKAKIRLQSLLCAPTLSGGGGYQSFRPSKTIQIPSDCVGFVIGKGGETIKRISQETGCRLQVEDEEEAKRLGHALPVPGHQNLHFIGTNDSVASAEASVMDLLQKKQRSMGRSGYNGQQTQAYQLRAQPYPTYAPAQYAQITQQAYAVAPQGYAPNQMQGYGSYAPQAMYGSYAPQVPQQQPTLGYPQTYTPTPQAYTYPPPQQPAPAGQVQGYQNQLLPPQGYLPNAQQPAVNEAPGGKQSPVAMPNGQQMPAGMPSNGAYSGIPPNAQFMSQPGMPNMQQVGHAGAAPPPPLSHMVPSQPPMNQPSQMNNTVNMNQTPNSVASPQVQANPAGCEGRSN